MRLKVALIALLVLVGIIVAIIVLYGNFRWKASINELRASMQAVQSSNSITIFNSQEIVDLPAPVQRYFTMVLKDGQALVKTAKVTHTGTFNMGDSTEKWVPFDSTQYIITQRPGFVWDARVRLAPGVAVFVHDAYVAGEGFLAAKVLGLFTVMQQPSSPELAQGELMRFFAEATWYPTAFLPCQGVQWEAINDTQASAIIRDGSTEVKLIVTFDEQGLISTVYSDGRYREVDGVQEETPWEGHFWDYEWQDGMLIPQEGEVAWFLPEGPKPYWRGRIQQIEYTF